MQSTPVPEGAARRRHASLRLAGTLLVLSALLSAAGGAALAMELETLDERGGTADVRGWVKDEDYEDLEGVRVTIGDRSAVTDGDGRYTLEGVGAGLRWVLFEKPGYVTREEQRVLVSRDYLDGYNRIDAPMERDATLDWRREDRVNVTVTVRETGLPSGGGLSLRVTGLRYGRSWDVVPGEPVVIRNLTLGRYLFNVTFANAGETPSPFSSVELFIDRNDTALDIPFDSAGNVTARLDPNPVSITGTAVVPEGHDPADVVVTAVWSGDVSYEVPAGPNDTFSLDVPPGRYLLLVWGPGLRQYEIRYLTVTENMSLEVGLTGAAETHEVPFDRVSYQTCMGLYVILAVMVLVAGLRTWQGRSYTFAVFGAVMGLFMGLVGAVGSPVCLSSMLALAALVMIIRSKRHFERDEDD